MTDYEDIDEPVNLDATQENADWIKTQSWDLPDTLEGIREAGLDPDKLFALPAGDTMPQSLQDEIRADRRATNRRAKVRGERNG